jgi:hypothetical protein
MGVTQNTRAREPGNSDTVPNAIRGYPQAH